MFDMARSEFARGMYEEALRLCDRSLQMHKLNGVEDFRAKILRKLEGFGVFSGNFGSSSHFLS